MILLISIVVALMFGSGAYLMLQRDLIRVITGMILVGNAANLFIMATGLRRGDAPVLPADGPMADPLVQAMTLTAVVIGFGVAALGLSLVYRVYDSHLSLDIRRISEAESEQAEIDDLHEQEKEPEVLDPTTQQIEAEDAYEAEREQVLTK